MCSSDLPSGPLEPETKIYVDLMRFPLMVLIRNTLRTESLFSILLLPLQALIYFFKRLTHAGLYGAIFYGQRSKFEPVQIKSTKLDRTKDFIKTNSFLAAQGFETLIDLQDRLLSFENVMRFLVNRQENTYAAISVKKANSKIYNITFFAVYNNQYVSLLNGQGFDIALPKNIIIEYHPHLPIDKLYQCFLETMENISRPRKRLKLESLLTLMTTISGILIKKGLEQKKLLLESSLKGTGKSREAIPSACYFHSTSMAVRFCEKCGLPVCDACSNLRNGHHYCPNCLPGIPATPGTDLAFQLKPPATRNDTRPFVLAGFGTRTVAATIDLLIIAVLTAGVMMGGQSLVSMTAENVDRSLALMLSLLFLGVFFPYYYLVLPGKLSQTIGQKILGLYVVESDGRIRGFQAALVRFSYVILSLMFVFPLVGYLFILFSKHKQGLHDRLADTFVIMPKSMTRTAMAWIFLVVLCGAGVWQIFNFSRQLLPMYLGRDAQYTQEAGLNPIWHIGPDDPDSPIRSLVLKNRVLIAGRNKVQSINIMTGQPVWVRENLKDGYFLTAHDSQDQDHLIITHFDADDNQIILKADPETGRTLFEINLKTREAEVFFDAKVIVTHDNKSINAYDMDDGKVLWTILSDSGLDRENQLILAENILYLKYVDDLTLIYIEKETGKILWTKEKIDFTPAYPLPEAHNLFLGDSGQILLYHLPDFRKIWETKAGFGYSLGTDAARGRPGQNPAVLYLQEKALDIKSGQMLFSYPHGYYYLDTTNDFLILSNLTLLKGELKNKNGKIVLAEKRTGKSVTPQHLNIPGIPSYLTENENFIYLILNQIDKSKKPPYATSLVKIDKSNFRMEHFQLGVNLYNNNIHLFPEESKILITTIKNVGLYPLP